MSSAITEFVVGRGAASLSLSAEELSAIVDEALADIEPGERVLAIVPDKTRDDNTDQLVPFAAEILSQKQVRSLDAVIAQGTHGPMSEAENGKNRLEQDRARDSRQHLRSSVGPRGRVGDDRRVDCREGRGLNRWTDARGSAGPYQCFAHSRKI